MYLIFLSIYIVDKNINNTSYYDWEGYILINPIILYFL